MKLLFVALLLSATSMSYSQSIRLAKNGLPYKANTIIVWSDLGREKLFEHIASILFDQNFEVKHSDKDAGIIQTANNNIKGGWYLRLSISVSDSVAKIKGFTMVPGLTDDPLSNYGMKGSLNLVAFTELDRIAKSINHKRVEYLPIEIIK